MPDDASLCRLVYVSQPLATPYGVILDIARASERRNTAFGLSGMLHYDPTAYAQYVEGPADGLAEVWRSIAADRRHAVVWHRLESAESRRISTGLPMGYTNGDRLRRHLRAKGPGALWTPDQSEALTDALVDIGHAIYPVAAAV